MPAPERLVLAVRLLIACAVAGPAAAAQPGTARLPAEAGSGADGLDADLYRPSGTGPFPAVVALHGCGGVRDSRGRPTARDADWAERLAGLGYLVVLPDSFGSRGAPGSQCGTRDKVARVGRERVADARAALAWLAGRPDVARDRIFLLGWSHGATTVLNTVRRGAAPAAKPDFRAAIAFYPGCGAAAERGWSTRLDLLMLVGEADDWNPSAPCRPLAAAQPGRVTFVSYPGAHHAFDSPREGVREVRGVARPDGGTGSVHAGRDPAARADSIERILAFLKAHGG